MADKHLQIGVERQSPAQIVGRFGRPIAPVPLAACFFIHELVAAVLDNPFQLAVMEVDHRLRDRRMQPET